MKFSGLLKTMPFGGAYKPVLYPIYEHDSVQLAKLITGEKDKLSKTSYTVTITAQRELKPNRKSWVALEFFLNNLPESLESDFAGKTKEWLYDYVRLKIGFSKILKVDEKVYEIPRSTSYEDCPDETEYINRYHYPMLDWIAHSMGYSTRFELQDAMAMARHGVS